MPPEVATPGDASYSGCAADIWSAGVVLFAMCLYALPFGNGTGGQAADTIRRIRSRDFTSTLPERLSPSLVDLIDVLLQVDPAARPTAQDLHRVSCGEIAAEGE